MWATYRQSAGKSVPAPVDSDTPTIDWWYDHVAKRCLGLARAGYTAIMLPPVLKAQGGSGAGCDGYGVFDDYDIGGKNQQGGVPTRFGERKQLLRLHAVARACGLDVYHDMVPHQRIGGQKAGSYRYVGADGRTMNGRFPKDVGCFWTGDPRDGYGTRDPIAGPVSDDFSFGDGICRIDHGKATPAGYMQAGLKAAGDWLFRTTGADGARIDDTKGQNAGMVIDWANHGAMAGKVMIGEFADGNAEHLNAWCMNSLFDAYAPGTQGRCMAFDFDMHYNKVQAMCMNPGGFDMRGLAGGFVAMNPTRAATFVENPDSDTNGFGSVVINKAAAYFLIMTMEGYPFVYWKDWARETGCYGLQAEIDNLVWIQNRLARGNTAERYADHDLYVYERTGSPGLLCAVNNSPRDAWRALWVETSFGPNVRLHDYTGHAQNDVWTNEDGWVEIWVPPNKNGLGYVALSRAGLGGAVEVTTRSITQTIFGADDLDVPALSPLAETKMGLIWVQAGSAIELVLKLLGAAEHDDCTLVVSGPDNRTLQRFTESAGRVKAQASGWHMLSAIYGSQGVTKPAAYELEVTYTAPQTAW